MRIYNPKLRNMAHSLSLLNVFAAYKELNLHLFYLLLLQLVLCHVATVKSLTVH